MLCGLSWIVTERTIADVQPLDIALRIVTRICNSTTGLYQRLSEPGELNKRFAKANAEILAEAPFKPVSGTVDVYPTELAPVLASKATWAGRPILQSYSAYTKALLEDNARHLEGASAPQNIYFTVMAIDDRLPAQDDSLSWPALFSNYDVVGLEGGYLRLAKGTGRPVTFGPEQIQTVRAGETITVPKNGMQWASIDLQPSLLGKMSLMLYKMPEVTIELTMADGRIQKHRLIPDIARHGFLLSPYIESSRDFVMAAFGELDKRVASIRVLTLRPSLWAGHMRISLRSLEIAPQVQAIRAIAVEPYYPMARPVATTGDCSIDRIERMAGGVVRMAGWISPAARSGIEPERVTLTLQAGQREHFNVPLNLRPDVAAAFNQPTMKRVGFDSLLDASRLSGQITGSVSATYNDKEYACQTTRAAG
ncbi:hypothetical protein AWV80_15735 [Cupriavidus sp. UYMU48A]|nr:hypothetical protein AWV80_15735 [Cupriavidus sp. UYMU48A]